MKHAASIGIRTVGTLVVLLLLHGCATQDSGPKPFPAAPPPQYALLFFYTQRHDPGKGYPTLYIEGTSVAKLPHDSYTWCYVTPGPHVVRAIWQDEHASMNKHLDLEFKGGQTMFLRYLTKGHELMALRSTFGIIDPVGPDLARHEIQDSTYQRASKDVLP